MSRSIFNSWQGWLRRLNLYRWIWIWWTVKVNLPSNIVLPMQKVLVQEKFSRFDGVRTASTVSHFFFRCFFFLVLTKLWGYRMRLLENLRSWIDVNEIFDRHFVLVQKHFSRLDGVRTAGVCVCFFSSLSLFFILMKLMEPRRRCLGSWSDIIHRNL